MYGKLFESLYTGSMVGKGCPMFAVWGYVIANMRPERTVAVDGKNRAYGAHVELNPSLLAFILGEKEKVIEGVITNLCSPDPKSRTKAEGGRRLVRLGEFDYRVVNGEHYRKLRSAEERREYQRTKQAEYRTQRKGRGYPTGDPSVGLASAIARAEQKLADKQAAAARAPVNGESPADAPTIAERMTEALEQSEEVPGLVDGQSAEGEVV